jgi:hypothetical protein
MKKTKPAAKSAKKNVMLSRKKTPKKIERKKAKTSTKLRYAARTEKRKAWAEKNPGMIPGEIGQPAHPKPVVETVDEKAVENAQEVLQAQTDAKALLEDDIDPDETVPGPGDVKTAIEVADEIKMTDKLEAGVVMAYKTGPREKLKAVDVTAQLGDRVDDSLE